MKQSKQIQLASILDTGIYEIDFINGVIYANRKRGRVVVNSNLLPTGYRQVLLFKGRNTGVKGIFYLHQVVYFAKNGHYDTGKEIDHIDGDKSNNRLDNLRLLTGSENCLNLVKPKTYGYDNVQVIRSKEIAQIKELMLQGFNQSRIARELNLKRLSVRNIMLKIQAGVQLKYA